MDSKLRTLICDYRPMVVVLMVTVLLVASSCTAGSDTDTGASDTGSSVNDVAGQASALDVLPGYSALRIDGCDQSPPETLAISEWYDWIPIQELVAESNLAVEGTVIAVSEPRVSSPNKAAALPDGPSMTYFRILTIAIDHRQTLIRSNGEAAEAAEVDVLLIGAGVSVQDDELCYGRDGSQDEREIPLEKGDEVVVVGSLTSDFPIVGLKGDPVVFLTSGFVGLWKVEDDGVTQSVVEEFALDLGELRARLADEFEAADAGESLEHDDALSNGSSVTEP